MNYTIDMFNKPTNHPWGMLKDRFVEGSYERENFLAWMLNESIDKGSFCEINTTLNHDHMIEEELLEKGKGDNIYKLSQLSLELLYKYYGKEEL
jgi:hypothetical protein